GRLPNLLFLFLALLLFALFLSYRPGGPLLSAAQRRNVPQRLPGPLPAGLFGVFALAFAAGFACLAVVPDPDDVPDVEGQQREGGLPLFAAALADQVHDVLRGARLDLGALHHLRRIRPKEQVQLLPVLDDAVQLLIAQLLFHAALLQLHVSGAESADRRG